MTKQTIPTWKQALDIAKSLQLEYQLPIFAMTYKGMCSCCAGAAYFNKEAYFPRNVAKMDAKDIDAYVYLKNSFNGSGEAKFYNMVETWGGDRKKVWNDFGTLNRKPDYWDPDGRDLQYVGYKLSENFTMKHLHQLLTRFVTALNDLTDTQYALKLPKDDSECAIITRIKTNGE